MRNANVSETPRSRLLCVTPPSRVTQPDTDTDTDTENHANKSSMGSNVFAYCGGAE